MAKSAFIDEVEINVTGGNGGHGIVSFLRERARPRGGPNGGNGGSGGSVLAQATRANNTLLAFRHRRLIRAVNGDNGGSGNCSGANGDDVVLPVPVGTRITDVDSGVLHADLPAAGDSVILATGGRGGRGNAHFKSSVNRAPRSATRGEEGESRWFRLELQLVADIGLLGLPNAGKSTFLRAISAAKPKVASYPFTTLQPQLGWVELERGGETMVVADIPGIIRGAAAGAGLGNRFLRHISRTTLLCQIADIASDTLSADCRDIDSELRRAGDSGLSQKPRWLLLNKADLLPAEEAERRVAALRADFPVFECVLLLSALTGAGVRDCVSQLLTRKAA